MRKCSQWVNHLENVSISLFSEAFKTNVVYQCQIIWSMIERWYWSINLPYGPLRSKTTSWTTELQVLILLMCSFESIVGFKNSTVYDSKVKSMYRVNRDLPESRFYHKNNSFLEVLFLTCYRSGYNLYLSDLSGIVWSKFNQLYLIKNWIRYNLIYRYGYLYLPIIQGCIIFTAELKTFHSQQIPYFYRGYQAFQAISPFSLVYLL